MYNTDTTLGYSSIKPRTPICRPRRVRVLGGAYAVGSNPHRLANNAAKRR